MAKTKIEDVIVPEVFEGYVIERTAEKSAFYQSGIVEMSDQFARLASGPGQTVEMPFWKDISGSRQLLSDTNALNTNKITASQDVARIHNDANSWSTNLLAELLSGSDPMEAIVSLVGEYWAREDEAMLISSLKGVFAAFDLISGDPNLYKIASETVAGTDEDTSLNGITFNNARQKLGDAKERLVAIAMHSEVENDLLNADQIEFIPDSDGQNMIKTFKGLRVIMDDSLPKRAGSTDGSVFTSVLFGPGAFAVGKSPLTTPIRGGHGTQGVEFARVALNSDDVLINRNRKILHPRGVKWNNVSIGEAAGPTNAELEEAQQWTPVYESKNIRLVGIIHNLNSQIPASS